MTAMHDPQISPIFNDCIDRLNAGESLEECLRAYPQFAGTLRPMLETALLVRRISVSSAEIGQIRDRVRLVVQRQLRTRRRPFTISGLRVVASVAAFVLVVVGTLVAASTIRQLPTPIPTITSGTTQAPYTLTPDQTSTATPAPSFTITPTSSITPTLTLTPTVTATAQPSMLPTVTPSHTLLPTQRPPTQPPPTQLQPTVFSPPPSTQDNGGGNNNGNDDDDSDNDDHGGGDDNSGGGDDNDGD